MIFADQGGNWRKARYPDGMGESAPPVFSISDAGKGMGKRDITEPVRPDPSPPREKEFLSGCRSVIIPLLSTLGPIV